MKICVKERLFAFLLALVLGTSLFMTSEIKAEATAEIVILGGLSLEEAVSYVFCMLGLTATADYISKHSGTALRDWGAERLHDFQNWAVANGKEIADSSISTSDAILDFFGKAKDGVIDRASAVYDWLYEYGQNLYSMTHADGFFQFVSVGSEILRFPSARLKTDGSGNYYNYYVYPFQSSGNLTAEDFEYYVGWSGEYATYDTSASQMLVLIMSAGQGANKYSYRGDSNGANSLNQVTVDGVTYLYALVKSSKIVLSDAAEKCHFSMVFNDDIRDIITNYLGKTSMANPDITGVGPIGGVSDRDKSLENVGMGGISSGAADADDSKSLPVDWPNVLDKSGATDYEKLWEKVAAGEIPWSDFMDGIGVIPIDKSVSPPIVIDDKDQDIPVPDYKPNPDYKPYIPPKPSTDGDYTVKGLENVFPFCIPFDLAAFVGVLSADPVAPKFTINCSFLGEKYKDKTITVDLAPWDKAAEIARDMEILVFIVGLILLTRNIIRG